MHFSLRKKKKTKIRQGSHLELTIADINSSTITSIFTYSEAERATGQVNELHSSPCWREDGSTSFCRKLQDTKKQKKNKALGWTLEAYDSIGRIWHPTLGWPQLTHSSCWTQSPASQGQQYIVDIIMCHLETVKTYLVLNIYSSSILLVVGCL